MTIAPNSPAPDPDPQAAFETKLRKHFHALTDEAREDDYVGLMLDLRDAKVRAAKLAADVRELKELMKGFEGEQADVIRRQAQMIRHKSSEMYCANEKAAAALRQVYVLKKRVKELERMGIQV